MSESKFTPGPWAPRGNEVYADGRRVADCDSHAPYYIDPIDMANARLIAAAPDLYAVCEEMAELLEADAGDYHGARRARERGLAALAKARGEVPQ